jgi:glucokinase
MAEAVAAIGYECHLSTQSAIGIGSPGPINLRSGVLGILPNLPGWDSFPLRDALAQATGHSVLLESDANAAAIAEWKMGAGSSLGLDSMAMVTLGTGVGAGLVLNGRIWQGMFGMAGEVGHATVEPNGDECNCGSRGCLELYASAGGVVRAARQYAREQGATPEFMAAEASGALTAETVAQLAHAADPAAVCAYNEVGRQLGIGLANLVSTLDIPLIVVGGGVAEAWKFFCEAMFQAMRDYSMVYRLLTPLREEIYQPDRMHVCPAQLGPMAGLLGAALLPRLAPAVHSGRLEQGALAGTHS